MKVEKKYNTAIGAVVIVAGLAILILILNILSPQRTSADAWVPWTYFLALVIIAMDMKFGIYARFDTEYFWQTSHFVFRKRIKITDIRKIMYKPTWIFGGNMKSIYIVDKADGAIKIRLANAAYERSTLVQIVNDIRGANPSIELDRDTQMLLGKSPDAGL